MSAFYVGQRVKLRYVRVARWQEFVGSEGTIIDKGNFPVTPDHGNPVDFLVSWDAAPDRIGQHIAEQLEPIVPPGLESLEEINRLWTPCMVKT